MPRSNKGVFVRATTHCVAIKNPLFCSFIVFLDTIHAPRDWTRYRAIMKE